jgi:selenocysteine lyase/cysteine desulfurase
MAIDILKVRQDTPAAESVLHFNSAGSSLMPLAVSEATIGYLKREVEIGGYEAASERHDELIGMYSAIARLLSCNADEIAFCESATRAWDSAIYSLEWKDGDRILSASSEYGSNYITFLHLQKKFGVKIDIIPDDENGRVSSEALLNMMGDDVKLVSVTHVPATSGLINPVAEIGSVLKSSSALYVVDATQSAGQIPLDVVEIGCDILVGTGRKYLRAPRGTGFLYMRKEVLRQTEPVFLDNRAAELLSRDRYRIHESGRRFEAFEYNFTSTIAALIPVPPISTPMIFLARAIRSPPCIEQRA